MNNNPYTNILKIMQKQGSIDNPPSIKTGVVLSVEPLLIKVGDLQLNKQNLLINESLIKHNRDFSINISANGHVNGFHGPGSLTDLNVSKQKIQFETILKPKDTVVVIPVQDMQTYIVLAKVV